MSQSPSFQKYIRSVWLLMQNGSFCAVVVFSLVYTAISGVATPAGVTPSHPIPSHPSWKVVQHTT